MTGGDAKEEDGGRGGEGGGSAARFSAAPSGVVAFVACVSLLILSEITG